MKLFVCFFALIASAKVVNGWKASFVLRKAASMAAAGGLLVGPCVPAFAVEDQVTKGALALAQVTRVKYSLGYINSDIEKASEADPIVKQVKLLLTNYQLKENVEKAVTLVPKADREDARKHGISAWEDLSTIFEYFEYDIDQTTGKRSAPPRALKLSYDATAAATRELDAFLQSFPSDIRNEVTTKVKSEFSLD